MTQHFGVLFLLSNQFSNGFNSIKMGILVTNNTADAIARFMESSAVVVFLILIGIFIMVGTIYGAKLWYDIKKMRELLNDGKQEPEQDTPE